MRRSRGRTWSNSKKTIMARFSFLEVLCIMANFNLVSSFKGPPIHGDPRKGSALASLQLFTLSSRLKAAYRSEERKYFFKSSFVRSNRLSLLCQKPGTDTSKSANKTQSNLNLLSFINDIDGELMKNDLSLISIYSLGDSIIQVRSTPCFRQSESASYS